jgi:hypothetical protein
MAICSKKFEGQIAAFGDFTQLERGTADSGLFRQGDQQMTCKIGKMGC